MRQLTSLDHQFLALETQTTYGHVSGLAVYDPSTRPQGRLTRADVCRLVSERIHLLPPFTWRLAEVPVSVITDGVGLNITCMSYLDQIDFGVVGDRDQIDDAWPFIRAIDRAYSELDEAVCWAGRAEGERASA